jgi:hypothetical protein
MVASPTRCSGTAALDATARRLDGVLADHVSAERWQVPVPVDDLTCGVSPGRQGWQTSLPWGSPHTTSPGCRRLESRWRDPRGSVPQDPRGDGDSSSARTHGTARRSTARESAGAHQLDPEIDGEPGNVRRGSVRKSPDDLRRPWPGGIRRIAQACGGTARGDALVAPYAIGGGDGREVAGLDRQLRSTGVEIAAQVGEQGHRRPR